MLKIKYEKTIYITKGDTLAVQVVIQTQDGGEYVPEEGDEIRFALKRNYTDPEPLITKAIPNDSLLLTLTAQETKALAAKRTPYVYDIQLTTAAGLVDTFIDCGELYVTQEVD